MGIGDDQALGRRRSGRRPRRRSRARGRRSRRGSSSLRWRAHERAHALLRALLAAGQHDPDVEVLEPVRVERSSATRSRWRPRWHRRWPRERPRRARCRRGGRSRRGARGWGGAGAARPGSDRARPRAPEDRHEERQRPKEQPRRAEGGGAPGEPGQQPEPPLRVSGAGSSRVEMGGEQDASRKVRAVRPSRQRSAKRGGRRAAGSDRSVR